MQLTAPHPLVEAPIASVGTWHVDTARTDVRFAVRHVMVATVEGRFGVLDGSLRVGSDGVARASGRINASTIDTGEPRRDARLRSAEFFDVAHHPVIAFTSNAIEHVEGSRFRIVGELTIRDVTHEIDLDATVGELMHDANGDEVIALELRGRLSQRAFGIGSQTLAANRVLLRDTIKIAADVTAMNEASS
jgi:polyisoprenoid-binding protein YceI